MQSLVAVLLHGFLVLSGLAAQEPRPKGGLGIFDTGQASASALTPQAVQERAGWTPLPPDASPKGDLVLSNGRISAVFRKASSAVELYSTGQMVRLALRGAARLDRVAVLENAKGAVAVDAAFGSAKGGALSAKFRLKKGEPWIEADPGDAPTHLLVEAPSRFVVLPDFFADDVVIDPAGIPLASTEAPSENFLLHLLGKGEAIAMCVFQNRDQDVRLSLGGAGESRTVTSSEIDLGKKERKVWVALLEGPSLWHAASLTPQDAGKTMPLGWTMPFPAAWRVDFCRTSGLFDSWEMLLQKEKDGDFQKPSWMGGGPERIGSDRKRWTTVLGTFRYPCWSNEERKGFLQPMKHDQLQFRGPVVVYPINRVEATPLEAFTVVDVVRGTLGVGPCQYILDMEGNRSEYKGRATCSTRDYLTPIYAKGEQKSRHKDVDKCLDDALIFVKHIRGRITRYVEFGKQMQAYLAEQEKLRPECKGSIAELLDLCRQIDARYAAREEKIKTPDYVAAMNEDFRRNVMDYEGADALDRCRKYARALVEIGDNQDELSGECRWVVKALRQKAGLLIATDPKVAPVALEIRTRTQEVLRNPAGHEGARH
jgi:hypothetical protein